MAGFGVGTKTLLSFCTSQDVLAWQRAKLTPQLFNADEKEKYEWVSDHLTAHHALPKPETFQAKFPDATTITVPEPPSFYLKMLENKFYHATINAANISAQEILTKDQDAHETALSVLKDAVHTITTQKYRTQVLDVGKEAPGMVISAYHNIALMENTAIFGWPYLDEQTGGIMPGDIVSIVGRPASGKSWSVLWTALTNWLAGQNVLFVSMEMGLLPVAQRITSMYTHCNVSQLKTGQFSKMTYDKFVMNLTGMKTQPGKLYVVNGNLAANMEDIYTLADQLKCGLVVIDGAYLVRHRNGRLDRFQRVADNCDLMKAATESLGVATFSSWQFNRDAVKNSKKSGKQETNLEDIGYSDAIGQISSIVCGLWEAEGVETMLKRNIRLMKGRNGEIGQFSIGWDFSVMNFGQVDPPLKGQVVEAEDLKWL